jgi:hydrogenase maturation protease
MRRGSQKTLIVGLGNPILSDDGIGCHIARRLQDIIKEPEISVMEASVSGLDFLDILTGYHKAIIIDAIQTGGGLPGSIYRLEPEAFVNTRHASTPHDVNFATALELGKRLGLCLPQKIAIYAIEVKDASSFGEECTPEVKTAIPACVAMILEELENCHHTCQQFKGVST